MRYHKGIISPIMHTRYLGIESFHCSPNLDSILDCTMPSTWLHFRLSNFRDSIREWISREIGFWFPQMLVYFVSHIQMSIWKNSLYCCIHHEARSEIISTAFNCRKLRSGRLENLYSWRQSWNAVYRTMICWSLKLSHKTFVESCSSSATNKLIVVIFKCFNIEKEPTHFRVWRML